MRQWGVVSTCDRAGDVSDHDAVCLGTLLRGAEVRQMQYHRIL